MIPELMSVGPGSQPCSIAMRNALSAYMPLLPRSRTTVNPEDNICKPLEAASIARRAVDS
jgi:hypothetical protein